MVSKVIFSLSLALLLSSLVYTGCTSPTENSLDSSEEVSESDSINSSILKYNRERTVFSLSWISNINAKMHAERSKLKQHAEQIHKIVKEKPVLNRLGQWKVVWGPYIYSKKCPAGDTHDTTKCVTDNTMVLFKKTGDFDAPDYVLTIAGTNPASPFGWFIEDFNVAGMIPWPDKASTKGDFSMFLSELKNMKNIKEKCPDQSCISLGTAVGVSILLNQMGAEDDNLLIDFLRDSTDIIESGEIAVAGHSLGGALSPSVALALHDNMASWVGSRQMSISTYPTAGASPGNNLFKDYLRNTAKVEFKGKMSRKDIVPHAWEADMLKKIPTIYAEAKGEYLDTVCVIENFIKLAEVISENRGYTSLYNQETETFGNLYLKIPGILDSICSSEKIVEAIERLAEFDSCQNQELSCDNLRSNPARTGKFLVQAGYQHTTGYVVHFDIFKINSILESYTDNNGAKIDDINPLELINDFVKAMEAIKDSQ